MSMLSSIARTGTSLLGTINTTANSLTQGVNTVASTLDMADAFIQKAKEKQYTDNKYEMEHYTAKAKANALINASRDHAELIKELEANPLLNKVYDTLKPEFDKLDEEVKKGLLEMRAKRTSI